MGPLKNNYNVLGTSTPTDCASKRSSTGVTPSGRRPAAQTRRAKVSSASVGRTWKTSVKKTFVFDRQIRHLKRALKRLYAKSG